MYLSVEPENEPHPHTRTALDRERDVLVIPRMMVHRKWGELRDGWSRVVLAWLWSLMLR